MRPLSDENLDEFSIDLEQAGTGVDFTLRCRRASAPGQPEIWLLAVPPGDEMREALDRPVRPAPTGPAATRRYPAARGDRRRAVGRRRLVPVSPDRQDQRVVRGAVPALQVPRRDLALAADLDRQAGGPHRPAMRNHAGPAALGADRDSQVTPRAAAGHRGSGARASSGSANIP